MKLGIGLYRNMLNKNNYRFAKQTGCTHIIAHLANYYLDDIVPTTNGAKNYGICDSNDADWSYDNLVSLKKSIEDEGLVLYAIENFSPADWSDVLLDGPKKFEQMSRLKGIIKNAGKAGIPVFGYNFSIAGVWGHVKKPVARGKAITATFDHAEGGSGIPIPNGQVWNMTYNLDAPPGTVSPVSDEQLWKRCEWFLNEILPVAEQYGVQMAAHPDDPPMPKIRDHARLVYQPSLYKKLLNINPSASNCIDFCMGSIQEMSEGNVYEAIEQYAPLNRISYVHFRNVKGKVPHYQETFVDDGDIDMIKAMRLFKKCGYEGVFIPDHTPQLDCGAPWHSGMAYALGYMRAAIQMIEME